MAVSSVSPWNAQAARVIDFAHHLSVDNLPDAVVSQARFLMLDLLGVAAAGQQTKTACVICDYATEMMAAGAGQKAVPILFDGREVSPAGAALAGGMMIDSIDAHDGYKPTKGHIGCSLLPSILAALAATDQLENDEALLKALVAGYEIGGRCGIALHQTACDYHTSGAWMAVAVAAIVAQIYGLRSEASWHAMGIAEYHGPRSQMMRVIDHASMLKDGSGWGAMAGVSAVDLAKRGFTGAPALLIYDEKCASVWDKLGSDWLILEQYIKLWPVCRWAQPAMQAVLDIWAENTIAIDEIEQIEIETFHESLRLASPHPSSPDEAQYSLCWPVAALLFALQEGRNFGPYDVSEAALARKEIHSLSARIKLREKEAFNAVFPDLRQSHVHLILSSGQRYSAFSAHTKGDPELPVSQTEMIEKFEQLIAPTRWAGQAEQIKQACLGLGTGKRKTRWAELLFPSS